MRRARRLFAIVVMLTTAPCLATPAALGQQGKAPPSKPEPRASGTSNQQKDKQPAIQPGREAREQLEKKGVAPSAADAVETRKILLEEAKYRKRLAKIGRLRELAERKQNSQMLAKLDELERKTTQLHQRKLARCRERLGDEKFNRVEDRLGRGRGKKGAGHGKGAGGGVKARDRAAQGTRGPGRPDAGPETGSSKKDQRGAPGAESKGKGARRGKGAGPDTGGKKPDKGGPKKRTGDSK
ncbi:MAG: hypothetical protein ACYTBR_15790 [Planctomycetota bacterium]|jgi:hypothetical protein